MGCHPVKALRDFKQLTRDLYDTGLPRYPPDLFRLGAVVVGAWQLYVIDRPAKYHGKLPQPRSTLTRSTLT